MLTQQHHPTSAGQNSRQGSRRGAHTVELAFVLPVFLIFLFGLIEFGRMVMVNQILTNAAREGARIAVLPGATDAEAKTKITTILSNCQISGYSTPTISPSATTAQTGTALTVSVNVSLDSSSWLPLSWLQGKTLTGKVVMFKE